jgi:hypothetical protein
MEAARRFNPATFSACWYEFTVSGGRLVCEHFRDRRSVRRQNVVAANVPFFSFCVTRFGRAAARSRDWLICLRT